MSLAIGAARAAAAPVARARRLDLDRAKGLAILLVVFGHIVARETPTDVGWYEPVRYAIYRFHMPFFLYLSGTVALLSGALGTPPDRWGQLAARRAERLLLPFFAIGLLILSAKLVAEQMAVVDNAPRGLAGGLTDLFWTTAQSPATSVWYLLVLFLCTGVAVVLRRLGVSSAGLVLIGLLLQLPEVPPIMYLNRFASHFLFFAVGVFVAEREARLLPAFEAWQPLWWGLFALTILAAMTVWVDVPWYITERPALVLCGLAAIPALHGAIRRPPIDRWQWPLVLGRYAMAIYLFNTLAIGAAKAALIKAGIGWNAAGFPAHVVAAMVAGVGGPILLKVLLLRRNRTLDRLTD